MYLMSNFFTHIRKHTNALSVSSLFGCFWQFRNQKRG